MKKKIIFSIVVLCSALFPVYGQMGIDTTTPRGALDINKPTTNTSGLVIPTNSDTDHFVNPQGGDVAVGTIIYDSSRDCIRFYKSSGWSRCLSDKRRKPPVVRMGQWAVPAWVPFNAQLTDTNNYGVAGTYRKISGIELINITSTLSGSTVDELLANFDIICTGWNGTNMNASDAGKIKEYVDRGGVALLMFDLGVGSNLLQAFGGNGNVGTGGVVARSTNDPVNNGIFGDVRNIPISGSDTAGRVLMSQLPPGSRLLATEATTNAGGWIAGKDGRAVFFWDEGVFRASVTGPIDTPQERFVHNVMAYALDQIR
ncbi:hypothetical protein [Chryseobacterium pennipullorum]|uniref:Uncharacterized protein n=1 Tax=Chryseobacterium pennipullorum TaxID=2258963 RepID=A0A3D9B6N8_9FLAO|nr:hypothetical protein [Chryseobacterium pennipullorum]REC49008.1 hypothetical protein DRF67_05475 [Chryseobacterium pennipullorum]